MIKKAVPFLELKEIPILTSIEYFDDEVLDLIKSKLNAFVGATIKFKDCTVQVEKELYQDDCKKCALRKRSVCKYLAPCRSYKHKSGFNVYYKKL